MSSAIMYVIVGIVLAGVFSAFGKVMYKVTQRLTILVTQLSNRASSAKVKGTEFNTTDDEVLRLIGFLWFVFVFIIIGLPLMIVVGIPMAAGRLIGHAVAFLLGLKALEK